MFRVFFAILLLIGTTIGAGMLALPMVTAGAGLINSLIFLVIMWLIMLVPAFYILELTLAHKGGDHLITMARNTLGMPGVVFLWLSNCLLLYSILAAYIAAGGSLVSSYALLLHFKLPLELTSIIFAIVMATFVILGIRVTGFANSIFMVLKAIFYFLLVIVMFRHAKIPTDGVSNFLALKSTVLTGVISFGYAMLIPSLYHYLDNSKKKIKLVIIIGTIIPLIIYSIWILALRLLVPYLGPNGLAAIAKSGNIYHLATAISYFAKTDLALVLSDGFTSICLLTTFLGASVCLSDVIADGLHMNKKGINAILVYGLTYLPPLIVIFFIPKLFMIGVNYAGIFALVYLLILPALMVYSARYKKSLIKPDAFRTIGGKAGIIVVLLIGFGLLGIGVAELAQ